MAQTKAGSATLNALASLAGDLIRDAPASLAITRSEDPWPAIVRLRETARSLAVADVMAAIARRSEG